MVSCTVNAMGKSMYMHLPVMDNKNNAIKNPDARKISDAMMRCLAKCIATFGIGLYVYGGEDLPAEEAPEPLDINALIEAIESTRTLEELREVYFAAVKMAHGNQHAIKLLEMQKDARKQRLLDAGINE